MAIWVAFATWVKNGLGAIRSGPKESPWLKVCPHQPLCPTHLPLENVGVLLDGYDELHPLGWIGFHLLTLFDIGSSPLLVGQKCLELQVLWPCLKAYQTLKLGTHGFRFHIQMWNWIFHIIEDDAPQKHVLDVGATIVLHDLEWTGNPTISNLSKVRLKSLIKICQKHIYVGFLATIKYKWGGAIVTTSCPYHATIWCLPCTYNYLRIHGHLGQLAITLVMLAINPTSPRVSWHPSQFSLVYTWCFIHDGLVGDQPTTIDNYNFNVAPINKQKKGVSTLTNGGHQMKF